MVTVPYTLGRMRKSLNFSKPTRGGYIQRYLLMLNDPDAFARRFGMRDPQVAVFLRVRAELDREFIRKRREFALHIRNLLRQWSEEPPELMGEEIWSLREERRLLKNAASFLATAGPQIAILFGDQFPKGTTVGDLRRLETRALPKLHRVLPQEAMQRLRGRLLVCASCDRVILRAPGKSAQKFCPRCRKRWSKQQLWYKTRGKRRRGR